MEITLDQLYHPQPTVGTIELKKGERIELAVNKDRYLLAQVGQDDFCFVHVDHGNRLHEPIRAMYHGGNSVVFSLKDKHRLFPSYYTWKFVDCEQEYRNTNEHYPDLVAIPRNYLVRGDRVKLKGRSDEFIIGRHLEVIYLVNLWNGAIETAPVYLPNECVGKAPLPHMELLMLGLGKLNEVNFRQTL